MSDNIAGYVDRSYVKGQAYRFAGCPVPTVFTGNINEISEDLLVKAMFVTNNGGNGTFPQEVGGQYLINTVKYGNDMYLQAAYAISTQVEYTRIYANGEWSEWVTSNVGDVDERVEKCETRLDSIYNENAGTGFLPTLTTDVRNLDRVDATNPANSGRVTKLENSLSEIGSRVNNKIQQVIISQEVTMGTAAEVNGRFQLGTELTYPKNGVLISMRVNTPNIAAISGTVYMLCYSANNTKPWINYQKGNGVTFSKIPHDFIFTFYVP